MKSAFLVTESIDPALDSTSEESTKFGGGGLESMSLVSLPI
jgi:hypothetical protein